MKFSFHLKNNSKVSLGKKNLNPSTSKASLDQSQVNSLTTIIPQPQIPIRKAFLNNSSTNSPIFASNNLINCMEIYFPRVKRASSIMLSLKKKSFSLQNVHSNSNEKSEKFKAKQIEWENFKKNPRYSYLERDSNVDQIPQEQLLEVAMLLLQKPPLSRKINDIKILKKSTEKVAFFQTTGSETHEQCLKAMTFKFYPKGYTVFELGTVGTTFYVLLQGSVGIWVNIPKIIKEEKNGVFEEKVESILTEIKVLSAGSSFGELALMEKKPRAATIRCNEDCCFAILDKKNFDLILKEIEQKKLYQQVEFFATMKIFSKWSYNAVKTLFLYTDQTRYILNQYVFKEGDEYEALYMVKSGEFEVSITLKMQKQNRFEEHEEKNHLDACSKDCVFKRYPVAVVTVGEAFGEEELLEKTKRKCSVKCISSSGELYMLNRKEFYRRVLTDETANLWLKKQIKIRRESRKKRIQNFIQQEMEFVLPKTKQNLEHYLGDFTEINANNLSLKLKYYSEDFSKREIYSREINPNANFFLPPAIELENLEKNTLSLEKVNLNNKKVLFHSSLSQSQEKFQSNVHRRLKTFMKEYDKNKLDDLKSKTFSLHSKKKPSSSLLKLNNHIKIQTLSQNNSGNRELEIPFILRNTNPNSNKNNFTNAKTNSNIINLNNIKKYVSDKNNCHNIKDSEYDLNYKRNLDPVENLLRKNSLSNQKKREWKLDQISPKRNDIKIKFDLLKEIPPNFKNQLLQKEENFEKSRTGWLNFKLQENRGKTYSCSGSFVGKKINSFEEKEKNNKILLESLKTQQGKKNKTIAFSSFHVIQRKYQGNRYTTNLFKNIC